MKFSFDLPLPDGVRPPLGDRAKVIACIPGVESVQEGEGGFDLRARVGLGPVKLRFTGTAAVRETGEGGWEADVSLHDPLSGSIYGVFALRPSPGGLSIEAEVTPGGRLGEFAAPLLRQKAEKTVREFGQNLVRLAGD